MSYKVLFAGLYRIALIGAGRTGKLKLQIIVLMAFLSFSGNAILFSADSKPWTRIPRDDRGLVEKLTQILRSRINIDLDWSRSDRYGIKYDLNKNGIPDLPNSNKYVLGRDTCPCQSANCDTEPARFWIRFDMTKTSWPEIDLTPSKPIVLPSSNEIPPNLRGLAGLPQSFIPTPQEAQLEYLKFREQARGFQIEVSGSALTVPLISATWDDMSGWLKDSKGVYGTCLPEGEYLVTVYARDWFSGDWSRLTKRITIEDFLMVSLGDSYGSGEGTPERLVHSAIEIAGPVFSVDPNSKRVTQIPEALAIEIAHRTLLFNNDEDYRIVVWADTGEKPDIVLTKYKLLIPHPSATPVSVPTPSPYLIMLRTSQNATDLKQASEEHKDHYRYHRSSFAPTSQAALNLQSSAKGRFSVTYVNLAMSGARTSEGVDGLYAGIEEEPFYDSNIKKAQLDELNKIVGKRRRIDALVFSLGGNDAGFANVIRSLVVNDSNTNYHPSLNTIAAAVQDGNWQAVEAELRPSNFDIVTNPVISGFRALAANTTTWPMSEGLKDLKQQYQAIAFRLQNELNVERIYLMEYPDPTKGSSGGFCDDVLSKFQFPLEIDGFESEFIYRTVLNPLNDTVKSAATAINAFYVTNIATNSSRHGLCAPRPYPYSDFRPAHPLTDRTTEDIRWVREVDEAESIMVRSPLRNKGPAHPNEIGYFAMAKELLKAIVLPEIKDEIVESHHGKEIVN